jgi:sugar phosphate isomerase/epimerase
VTDRLLLTADLNNIEDCIALAVKHNLGLEIMAFAYPHILDGNWEHEVATYRSILRAVPGPITLHGPFMDMVSGSPDDQINQVCFLRYQHAIYIASQLESKLVVLHANFIGSLRNPPYRKGWHDRNVQFWEPLAEFAHAHDVTIALENMWEFEPQIIAEVLRDVNHPNLRACIDVGHAHLYGDDEYSFQDWLDTMEPWLVHMHMNNNNGKLDEHHSFDWPDGVLDYKKLLTQVHALKTQPNIVLEMWSTDDMRQSLHYFDLDKARATAEVAAITEAAAAEAPAPNEASKETISE